MTRIERATPLKHQHLSLEATMGQAGDCEMPLHYGSPLEEVETVHRRAGVFDLSHLGRIRIRGDGALDLLERVCTADVARQDDDTALHTLLLNEAAGILDECMLLRMESFWVLTTNAANRAKVIDHLHAHADGDVRIDDQTDQVAHLLACGPEAAGILEAVLPISVAGLARNAVRLGSLMVANYIAARCGYTRQWALEVMVPAKIAPQAWGFITAKAGDNRIRPVGLLARDVLRMEAGLCRYGHEVSEATDPLTAGLSGCLDLGRDFLGAEAVDRIVRMGVSRRRVLLSADIENVDAVHIPRQGATVYTGDRHIGTVTSATWSPHRQSILAMGYLVSDAAVETHQVRITDTPPLIARIERVFE